MMNEKTITVGELLSLPEDEQAIVLRRVLEDMVRTGVIAKNGDKYRLPREEDLR